MKLWPFAIAGALAGVAFAPRPLPHMGVRCNPQTIDPAPCGAHYASTRCGHVELQDSLGMRLGTDPSKPVVAVGDSFTYGYGVAEEDAWPALIGASNAGIPGASVENVADVVRWLREPRSACRQRGVVGQPDELPCARTSPPLAPGVETIVYGMYVNDVSPRWSSEGGTLEYLLHGARTRRALEAIVEAADTVPVYLIVLDRPEDPHPWLVRWIEHAGREAGMRVIPSPRRPGEDWRLADDEWHSNEHGHRVWADAVGEVLNGR